MIHADISHLIVNGVEAFLVTVLGEYKDAEKRFDDICKQISRLITPPLDFMFQSGLRDKLLFEDDNYTYSKRYFWALQTLGIMIDSMTAMVDAYEDHFTDDVWEGRHRTLWPLLDPDSLRNKYYRKKMSTVRDKFELQVSRIRKLIKEYDNKRTEINRLRDQLFSGTSVMEARKSVQQAEITVQQGHNIKLLTLVNLFFLPLTFVTSVFGMEILPERSLSYSSTSISNADKSTDEPLWRFAAVTVAICLPCFILIGSLNSRSGMHWWQRKLSAIWQHIRRMWPYSNAENDKQPSQDQTSKFMAPTSANDYPLPSSTSTNAKMARRLRRLSSSKKGDREKATWAAREVVPLDSIAPLGTSVNNLPRQGTSRRMSEMMETLPVGQTYLLKEEMKE